MKGIYIILLIILVSIILFVLIKEITKVEVHETLNLPAIPRTQNLEIDFRYYTLDAQNDDYVFKANINNKFPEKANFNIFSTLKLGEIKMAEAKFSDSIESQKSKSYDLIFENIFDASKISGLNFCEKEEKELECSKNKGCDNGVCLENCKCYYIDKKSIKVDDKERNLYCIFTPTIETNVSYSSKVRGVLEIEFGSEDNLIKLPINAPFETFVLISPTPYSNLLPTKLAFEFRGEDVKIKKVTAKTLNYSLRISTFFGERTEEVESQECNLDLNILVNGRVYSGRFGKDCVFQPVTIKIREKEKVYEENKSSEIRKLIENVCKDKNESECSKDLVKKAYNLCSVYDELEICKKASERINSLKVLIEIEFEKSEKYKRGIDVKIC